MATNENDNDFEPLVGSSNGRARAQPLPLKERASSFRSHWKWAVPLIAVSILVLYNRVHSYDAQHVDSKQHRDCPKTCQSRKDLYKQKWGGDLSQTSFMLKRAEEERERLVAQLKVDYGQEYFPLLFQDENGTSIGKTGFHGGDRNSDVSRRRYIRKLMMKILSVQMAVQKETSRAHGCDCSKRYLQASKNASFPILVNQLPDHYARMVWVNAGHSSAAGHGNPLNETYTAFMEQAAKSTFQAVGIELEGRNYAMGGMSSSPELALCAEAVYGMDADLITWNFGMTDGNQWYRHAMFGNRRGAHANRPLLLDLDAGPDRDDNQRLRILKELEESGLATMFMAFSNIMYEPIDAEPDMENMTQAEMDAVPAYLRHFRCGDKIEKGDLCGGDSIKYSNSCAPHKAPWHPGWRAHALNGNVLALFMVDLLIDALKSLNVEKDPDREQLLKQLQQKEDEDYETFFNSTIKDHDDNENDKFVKSIFGQDDDRKEKYSLLYRSPTLCHTGLLPADTRYRGILTENNDQSSFEHYDFGILKTLADQQRIHNGTNVMPLVYDSKVDCPGIQPSIDYKDYFYTTHNGGETKLTIPNKAEKDHYMTKKCQEFQGLIVMCLVKCDWGRCAKGDMRPADVQGGNVTLAVNGEPVQEMTELDDCTLLRGEQGYMWKPNDQGEYDITAKIHHAGGFFRISSVILM